jgi:hypothetical protein
VTVAEDFGIRLFHNELDKILKSDEVMAKLHEVADRVVAAHPHPEDLEVEDYTGRSRDRVSVKTKNPRAHVREARDHTLVQALAAIQEVPGG